MDSEAKIIIAFLFNRSGKNHLTESELYLPLSMELGWLSTKESQEFVNYAIKQGLLVKKENKVLPNFPIETVTIPVGFFPSKKHFSGNGREQQGSIIDGIINGICEITKQRHQEIAEEMLKEEKEKHLLPAVAALYVARKHGVEVDEWFDAVESTLLTEKT